jgi:hypothetical protein
MQVNNSTNIYSYTSQVESNNTKSREAIVNIVENRSTKAKIDAYVAGSKQANENYQDLESTQESTQNYTDFASDVRRSKNYSTYLDNGGDASKLINKPEQPSIQPIQNPNEITQEQTDALRQSLAGIAGYKSTQDQIDVYKDSSQQSKDINSTYQDTQAYVTNYNEFANQARRDEYINIYMENSKQLA